MKWLLGYLNPNDYVTFRTDLSEHNEFIHYSKFIQFVLPIVKKDSAKFLECLNSHYTFFINLENGFWEIYKKEYRHATFDELVELNQKREERKKLEKENVKFNSISMYKTMINNISERKWRNGYYNRDKQKSRETISSFFNRARRGSYNK